MSDPASEPPTESAQPEARFHYIKGNLFRTIHSNGVWMDITPLKEVALAFYNERNPIPQETFYALDSTGQLGAENRAKRVSKEGYVREVEAQVVMSLELATALHAWLTKTLPMLQQQPQEARPQPATDNGETHAGR